MQFFNQRVKLIPKSWCQSGLYIEFLNKINNNNSNNSNNNRGNGPWAGVFDHMYMCTSYSKLDVSQEIKVNGIVLVIGSLQSKCSLFPPFKVQCYALLSSSFDWMSLETLISIVSGFRTSFPFSSFKGNFSGSVSGVVSFGSFTGLPSS